MSATPRNPYQPMLATLTAIRPLTSRESLFEVRLDDEAERDAFSFTPGQFVELSVFGVGEAPISISSAAGSPGSFELCVRDAGDVTGALHRSEAGAVLGVRGPFGHGFPADAMRGHDVVLIAGGLGIAPLKSLVDHIAADRGAFGRLIVLYGAKRPEDLLFAHLFDEWRDQMGVELTTVVDQPDATWDGPVGVVTSLLGDLDVDGPSAFGAVCGPPAMYRPAAEGMLRLGMDADRVFVSFERRMKCGIGHCGHCGVGDKYTCIDGPVFSLAEALKLREAI